MCSSFSQLFVFFSRSQYNFLMLARVRTLSLARMCFTACVKSASAPDWPSPQSCSVCLDRLAVLVPHVVFFPFRPTIAAKP